MKTRTKITAAIVLTAIVSGAVFSGLSYYQSRNVVSQAAFADIEALRDAKSAQIEEFFDKKIQAADSLSKDILVATAMIDLQAAFRNINQGNETVLADVSSNVRDYYERRALPPIAKSLGVPNASYDIYGPKTRAARHLQNVFNVSPKSSKSPRQKSYEALHGLYDDKLKSMAAINGFADILLIDMYEGDVIYSANKGIDFGTNVYNGPFGNSALGQSADTVRNTSGLQVSDIELYAPAQSEASAFIAVPVYDQNIPIGILALRMEAEQVSALSAFGLKARGDRDVYLAGGDYLMRSNAPFAQDNLNAYVRVFRDGGGTEDIAKRIKLGRSTILAQPVMTESVKAALSGQSGAMVTQNYLGNSVISAYAPINIGANDWVILAERSAVDVYTPFNTFAERLAIAAAIFIPLLLLLALWMASRLMRPARAMLETARAISSGESLTFAENSSEWGRIGSELNKAASDDIWHVQKSNRTLASRKPIKLISIDTPKKRGATASLDADTEPPKPETNQVDFDEGDSAIDPELRPAAVDSSKRPKRAARSDAGFKSGAFPERIMAPRERRKKIPPMNLVANESSVPVIGHTEEAHELEALTQAAEIEAPQATEPKIVPLSDKPSRFRRRRR